MVLIPSHVLYSRCGGTNHHNQSTYGARPRPRMLHISLGLHQPNAAHPSQGPWYVALPLPWYALALPDWLAQPAPLPFQPGPTGLSLTPLPMHNGGAYERCLQ